VQDGLNLVIFASPILEIHFVDRMKLRVWANVCHRDREKISGRRKGTSGNLLKHLAGA